MSEILSPLRVLHLEPSAEAGKRARQMLSGLGGELHYMRLTSLPDFQRRLEETWNIFLCREDDADEVVRLSQASRSRPACIVTTESYDPQKALALAARGATAVITRDLTQLAASVFQTVAAARERHELQRALREAQGRLEHRVEERTAELHMLNQILRQEMEERQRAEQNLRSARLALTRLREDERLRLSREIHDGVVQDLLGIGFAMADTERQLAKMSAQPLQSELAKHRSDVLAAVRRLRQTIKGLRPPGLAEFGLVNALKEYVESLQVNVPNTALHLNMSPKVNHLPEAVAQCFYRVAQEAVRNALRYSRAGNITLAIGVEENTAGLIVADDGQGFDPPSPISALATQNHYGLVGMDEQASLVGGELHIESRPEHGTTVRVTVPL